MTGKDKYKEDVNRFIDLALSTQQTPQGLTWKSRWGPNRYAGLWIQIKKNIYILKQVIFKFQTEITSDFYGLANIRKTFIIFVPENKIINIFTSKLRRNRGSRSKNIACSSEQAGIFEIRQAAGQLSARWQRNGPELRRRFREKPSKETTSQG